MPHNRKKPPGKTWDPENVFHGTAWYYARYRPIYPNEVINILRNKFELSRDSRVLDLGCGTGQISLELAPYVSEVIAIDPQPEMLREGKLAATSQKITNIRWLKGESSKLPQMTTEIGDFKLTVIARAFHWMDREQTLADLFGVTVPGGGVAVIADTGPLDGKTLHWKEIIQQTVKKWLGPKRKAGIKGTYTHSKKRYEAFLRESKFSNFKSSSVQMERSWSLDEIIGYLYSTSLSSIPVLGDKKEPFEADLRKRLIELQPTSRFKESVTINIVMAWKSST